MLTRYAADDTVDLSGFNAGAAPEGGNNVAIPSIDETPATGEPAAPPADAGQPPSIGGGPSVTPDLGMAPPSPTADPFSPPVDNEKDLQKVKEITQDVSLTTLSLNISELRLQLHKLSQEHNLLYKKQEETKKILEEYLLFKIPSYAEIELPSSRKDPQYLIPYITNALDSQFTRLFQDIPLYNPLSFIVLDEDFEGNIVNAIVEIEVSFNQVSKYSRTKFKMEMFIIEGFLNIPKWLLIDNKLIMLTEEGIRKLNSMFNPELNQAPINPMTGMKETWYTAGRNQQNEINPRTDAPNLQWDKGRSKMQY